MKLALILVGALVVLIAIIVVIGTRLPVAHTASRSAFIARTPADVYAYIRARTAGEKDYEIAEEQPLTRFVARVRKGLPYGGTWTFDLVPERDGTRLTITENGEVYNPLFRFLARFVFGHTATMDKYLADLAAAKQ